MLSISVGDVSTIAQLVSKIRSKKLPVDITFLYT